MASSLRPVSETRAECYAVFTTPSTFLAMPEDISKLAAKELVSKSRSSLEIFKGEKVALQRFLSALEARQKQEEIAQLFQKISPSIRNTFFYWVGVFNKASPETASELGQKILSESFKPLLEVVDPYISQLGGHLLGQMFASLNEKIEVLEVQEIVSQLEELQDSFGKEGTNRKNLLNALPQSIQNELHGAIFHCSQDPSKHTNPQYGKDTLEKDEKSLVTLIDGRCPLDIVLQEYRLRLKKEFKGLHFRQQQQFTILYTDPKVPSSYLEKIYGILDPRLQERLPFTYSSPRTGFQPTLHSFELYKKYGAHPTATGTKFCVRAPNAKAVNVLLTSDGRTIGKPIPMKRESTAVGDAWVLYEDGVKAGQTYLYQVVSEKGAQTKIDPFGIRFKRNKDGLYETVVCEKPDSFKWTDDTWIANRKRMATSLCPINVYEVHAAFWKRETDRPLYFNELAKELAEYCKEMRYTHVELFGLLEHPYEGSWGYQPLSLFAPNHRLFDPDKTRPLGSIEQIQSFVNILHENDIGVILDFIPDHFAKDDIGLIEFDGSPLFQWSDRRTTDWGPQYDFSNRHTRDYLISAAHFWVNVCHFDGLRVDAVEVILNKSRYGGRNCPEAVSYLRRQNKVIHTEFPGVKMIAESADPTGMTAPRREGGFAFDLTWAFNIAKDTIKFLKANSLDRKKLFKTLEHIILGADAGQEHVVPSFSHDEINQEKGGSLFTQVFGKDNESDKFANVRLFHVFSTALPTTKLQLMGTELATKQDWSTRFCSKPEKVNWKELEDPAHNGVRSLCIALNKLYKETPDFWASRPKDSNYELIAEDAEKGVISFWRGRHVCVFNFGDASFDGLKIHLKTPKPIRSIKEAISSQPAEPSGADLIPESEHAQNIKTINIRSMLPYSGRIFETTFY